MLTMSRDVVVVLYLMCLVGAVVQDHLPVFGVCPNEDVQQHFSLKDYGGIWFAQAGYNTEMVNGGIKCLRAQYTMHGNDTLEFIHKGIINSTNLVETTQGVMNFSDSHKEEGKLTEFIEKHGKPPERKDYWVLDTDYKSFAVMYSCRNIWPRFHVYFILLLSRESVFKNREEEEDFYRKVAPTLRKFHIQQSDIDILQPSLCVGIK